MIIEEAASIGVGPVSISPAEACGSISATAGVHRKLVNLRPARGGVSDSMCGAIGNEDRAFSRAVPGLTLGGMRT
jgi:hypothetical protein